jgi:hypothetical protein
MASSEVTICNLALGKLGAGTIIALDEESTEARACKLHYAPTRDEVLRHHLWNFAITRVSLVLEAEPPAFEWSYQYELPTDCLRVIEVNGWQSGSTPRSWEVEGRRLMSNSNTAEIRYVRRVTDCNLFDAIFVEALSLKLASKISRPLNGSSTMASEFLTEYEKITGGRARRVDAFESDPVRRPAWKDSDLVASRFQQILS